MPESLSNAPPRPVVEKRIGSWTPGLDAGERETLMRIAEETLRWCTVRQQAAFPFQEKAITPRLKRELATFVTLERGGLLRGCIGSLAPVAPLYRSVHDNTVRAALHDNRFRPVTADVVLELTVKISILSPMQPIADISGFRIGEHGIVLSARGRRAVFLPEVALEQGWTVEDTQRALCEKAGLARDEWHKGAAYEVFTSVLLCRGA